MNFLGNGECFRAGSPGGPSSLTHYLSTFSCLSRRMCRVREDELTWLTLFSLWRVFVFTSWLIKVTSEQRKDALKREDLLDPHSFSSSSSSSGSAPLPLSSPSPSTSRSISRQFAMRLPLAAGFQNKSSVIPKQPNNIYSSALIQRRRDEAQQKRNVSTSKHVWGKALKLIHSYKCFYFVNYARWGILRHHLILETASFPK